MNEIQLSKVNGIVSVDAKHSITGAYLVRIKADAIEIDPEYQRERDEKHINNIISNYWSKAVGTPDLAYKDGKFYAVNGQHTIAVLIEKGETIIPCWVHSLDFKESCQMFSIHNSGEANKRMGSNHEFKVSVKGGNVRDNMICDVAHKIGFTLPIDADGLRGRADLTSISMLRDAAQNKNGSEKVLTKFLTILKAFKVNGSLDKSAKLNPFQRGLFDCMMLNPSISASKFVSSIKKVGYSAGTITSKAAMIACNGRADRNHFRKVFEKVIG